MIVLYFCVVNLLVKANQAYKYFHPPSYSYLQSGHGGLHNYVATIQEVPFHVLIVYNNLYCSGSLIRSRVVLSAASCFIRWNHQKIVVKVGSTTVTGIGQVIEVVAVKRHEYFGHANFIDNDIALLMLKNHVNFNPSVEKILIIEPEMALQVGTPLDVFGWASQTMEPPKFANRLLWSEMVLLEMEECFKYFPNLMSRSNFCASYTLERRISDNGGPAVFKDVQVGILSFGADSTKDPYVAILTNVSYFHRWINLNTRRFMKKFCVERHEYYVEYNLNSEAVGVW